MLNILLLRCNCVWQPIKCLGYSNNKIHSEVYSEPYQTSVMEVITSIDILHIDVYCTGGERFAGTKFQDINR